MKINYKYKILKELVYTNIIFVFVLLFINLILMLWINEYINLSQVVYLPLYILLPFFEIFRSLILLITVFITVKIDKYQSIYIIVIILNLFTGIIFNCIFLTKLFGYACFTPILNYLSIPFVILSSIMILIKKVN
jgi:predicted nucleic acid-binding protein